jgi:hypothetical protein
MSAAIISLNNISQLISVMVKCGVLFEVRTEFLNNIYTSFVFKGLNLNSINQLIFCNGEVLCSLWGTDWILKWQLDKFKLGTF